MSVCDGDSIAALETAGFEVIDSARPQGGLSFFALVQEPAQAAGSLPVHALYNIHREGCAPYPASLEGWSRIPDVEVLPYSDGYFMGFNSSLASGASPVRHIVTTRYDWRVMFKSTGLHMMTRTGVDGVQLAADPSGNLTIATGWYHAPFELVELLAEAYYPARQQLNAALKGQAELDQLKSALSRVLTAGQVLLGELQPGEEGDVRIRSFVAGALRVCVKEYGEASEDPGMDIQDCRYEGYELLQAAEQVAAARRRQ